jgi:hypothetical protein
LDQSLYHVVLDGETLGPYDKRTIIGMRVKKTLTNESVLIREDGRRFTVEEIVRESRGDFDPGKSGTHSLVKAAFEAEVVESARSGPLPRYEGMAEVRVQSDVLRIAGRLRGKDDRVKIPLADVVHARAREADVELWLRAEGTSPQPATCASRRRNPRRSWCAGFRVRRHRRRNWSSRVCPCPMAWWSALRARCSR